MEGKKNKLGNDVNFYQEMEILSLKPTAPDYNDFLLVKTEEFVRSKLSKKMTKTQMRNVFELVKGCSSFQELNMTKPKLIYTAGRVNGEAKKFLLELAKLVTTAKDKNDVDSIKKLIETILAYHKYYAQN